MPIQGTHIAILGAGESGIGAAILAQEKGWEVFASDYGQIGENFRQQLDELRIDWEEGQHDEHRILSADLIVKSPGIPPSAPIIRKAMEKQIPVISEIEFGSYYSRAKTICITGSNGKTTTTMLTYHILKKAGFHVGLAGNVGQSFAKQIARESFDWYVLELSSFQLDDMYEFKADIAILLNITPDHLDRYDHDMNKYARSKFRITQNQGPEEYFIYNADDPIIQEQLQHLETKAQLIPFSIEKSLERGGYTENEHLIINIKEQFNMSIHDLALKGKHNTQNSLASGLAARILDIRKEVVRESFMDFVNVEHRLEFVAKINGIEFINDSKATNINATWFALESMEKPTVWIVGGIDKGNDYNELMDLVKHKVKAIICLGKDNRKIKEAFEGQVEQIVEAQSAMEAVAYGYRLAKKDETVLLSPACASFDLFENYEDRGDQFKNAVRSL